MKLNGPVEIIYGLTLVFLILSIVFLMGKGSSLIVGHSTVQKEKFSTKKVCRAIGICCSVMTTLLGVTSVLWNYLPDWYGYLFLAIITIDILAVVIICNINIIFRV